MMAAGGLVLYDFIILAEKMQRAIASLQWVGERGHGVVKVGGAGQV